MKTMWVILKVFSNRFGAWSLPAVLDINSLLPFSSEGPREILKAREGAVGGGHSLLPRNYLTGKDW